MAAKLACDEAGSIGCTLADREAGLVSAAEVSAALQRMIDDISRERGRAAAALHGLQEGRSRLATILLGTRHPLAARAMEALNAAIDRLREADHLAAQGTLAVVDYARALGITSPQRPASPPSTRVSPVLQRDPQAMAALRRRSGSKMPAPGCRVVPAARVPPTGCSSTRPGSHSPARRLPSRKGICAAAGHPEHAMGCALTGIRWHRSPGNTSRHTRRHCCASPGHPRKRYWS
ncbi:hypothetical protein BDK92_0826 [Micromonospora pisi]|uniref:Uncharacterized protein n=1 Tax=Micromonospora pisi TaxID=589240 RepID=A0A495JDZ8_9ACTN|nr:hypothetical protein BDK92_0826 [Micromonospora pisi]